MLEAFLAKVRERREGLRKFGLVTALIIFIGGIVIAFHAAPDDFLRLNPPILLGYLVIIPPISYALQCADVRLSARAAGTRLSWKQAIEVVVYSNVATLLPIPGGLLTRVAALRTRGVSTTRSAMIVLLFTGIIGTVSFAYAGAWLVKQTAVPGIAFLGIALLGAFVCAVLARRAAVSWAIIAQEVLLRLLVSVLETISFVIIFAAIGVSVGIPQAAVLVLSSFVGLVVNVVPSGIGIREGVVALLSPSVGIDPAIGFLAASIARIVAFLWLAGMAAGLLIRQTAAPSRGSRQS
jgi:hypothetical protein